MREHEHFDYLQARRPWLSLYNVRLKPTSPPNNQEDLAPIQRLLPDEILWQVFLHLGPHSLAKVACSCRHWRALSEHPKLWEKACIEAFAPSTLDLKACKSVINKQYGGSWRRVFLLHPHVRFDGLYVARNTYVKAGVTEWNNQKSVHLVTYFRYYRFFPDKTLWYRTTPQTVAKVAKSMRGTVLGRQKEDSVQFGKFIIKGDNVYCVIVYPNSRSTEIRCRLGVRSTHPGANNRLDILCLVSYDWELGQKVPLERDPDDEPEGAGSRKEYGRGLSSFEFVPWENIHTSQLNLPVSQMDFYVPG